MIQRRVCGVLVASLLLVPRVAFADLHFVPFGGRVFLGATTLVDPELVVARPKWVFGGTVTFIDEGFLGVEGDFGYISGFFQSTETAGTSPRVTSSRVVTLMGNVVLVVPKKITRESLRPYLSGGAGLLSAHRDFRGDVFQGDANMWGINLGGGATGFVTDFTGVRWDVRYFRSVGQEGTDSGISLGTTRLSFWRATMGIVVKY